MAVALKSPKTTEKQWRAYVKSLEQGGPKSSKMEALRPFMGARGNILKRNTRSNKQREAFNAAVKDIQKTYGRKTKAPFSKAEKQKQTAARNAVKKHQRKQHKKQTGKPLTKTAKKIAEEAANKYSKMLDILTEGSQQLLSAKVRYEIYKVMDEEEVSDEDIEAFIDKLLEILDDIPEEAKELNRQDDFYEVLLKIRDMGITDLEDIKTMFIALADHPDDHDSVLEAIDYWQENNNGMGFTQFYDELEQYNEMWDRGNWAEILGEEDT